jgi:hypothetical protein
VASIAHVFTNARRLLLRTLLLLRPPFRVSCSGGEGFGSIGLGFRAWSLAHCCSRGHSPRTDGGREGERGVARERKGEEEKVVEEVYRQAA